MCVPLFKKVASTLLGGILGKKSESPAPAPAAAAVTPATEQETAEAKAAQSANAKLAEKQRRRRLQNNLLAQADEWALANGGIGQSALQPSVPAGGHIGPYKGFSGFVQSSGGSGGYDPAGPNNAVH